MTEELIDKCLDFAEGNKGKFTILMVKKPGFPETLIEGTKKQREINDYIRQGFTTREIADKMGCSQPNVLEHMRQYKKSAAFYGEWCKFWEFAAQVRQAPIAACFKGILSDSEINWCWGKKIKTVGDLLNLAVTNSTTQMYKTMIGLDAEKKAAIFQKIKEMCYENLQS